MVSDIDLMFKHIDSIMTINLCCGESLLNKELADVYTYAFNTYHGRYYEMALQTNGTIIPSDDIMQRFAESKTVFSISEYPENAQSISKLIEKCDEYNISWYLNRLSKRENWYDFGNPRILSETDPQKLRELYSKCWIPGNGIYEGWAYLCVVQSWSHAVACAGTRDIGDAFDLRQPKTESNRRNLHKLISRQPDLGYVSHCMRCKGTIPIVERSG
jgi:hypothetical protein